ncbi:methyltransferase domain-containing protein [Cetobacterium sp. SF1]|uniref:methyltransferase domain-containing protein n=1 Tax=unclassified Cetobacterium TaxID=2630983 RepID=UPI003CEFA0B4
MLICPICKENLIKENNLYKCNNNHSFDISKYGHSNLLLSNQKNSKLPGDNKEMVLARKHFLSQGYYKGISDSVNKIILNLTKNDSINILDIGCGEGYYTNNLKEFLSYNNISSNIIGIDISKEAIIAAAKAFKNINWIVASAMHLPIKDESLDFILCMFAKIIPEEKFRTLKKGGKVIIVSTGEEHLLQLKEVVYDSVRKDHYSPVDDMNIFKYIETINTKYETTILGSSTIENLFNMTPYRWRSPQSGIEKLLSLDSLTTTIEVNIDIFEKI